MSNLFQPSPQSQSQTQTNEKQHKVQNSYRINKILIYRMLTACVMITLISYCPFWNETLKTFLKCFRNHDVILLKRLIDITKDTYELPHNRYGGDDRGWMFWLQDTALKFFRLNNPAVKLLRGHLFFSLKTKESDIFAIALGTVS